MKRTEPTMSETSKKVIEGQIRSWYFGARRKGHLVETLGILRENVLDAWINENFSEISRYHHEEDRLLPDDKFICIK